MFFLEISLLFFEVVIDEEGSDLCTDIAGTRNWICCFCLLSRGPAWGCLETALVVHKMSWWKEEFFWFLHAVFFSAAMLTRSAVATRTMEKRLLQRSHFFQHQWLRRRYPRWTGIRCMPRRKKHFKTLYNVRFIERRFLPFVNLWW